MTDKYRISVSVPESLRAQVEELKNDEFYNLSYSEFYRRAISAGIRSIKCKGDETADNDNFSNPNTIEGVELCE